MKRSRKILTTFGLGFALWGLTPCFAPSPAWADAKGDKEKAEEDLKKAEKGQKEGQGQPGQGQQGQNPFENPLEKILKLMQGVEERLFDADTGEFTQEEQKKIIDAMRFEDKTKKALDELINKIENSQNQSSSSSSSSSQQQKQQQKQSKQNQQDQQQKSKEQQEREKEQERQRQAQREKEKQQQQSAQNKTEEQKRKEEEQKRKQQQQEKQNAQRERSGAPQPDQQGDLNDPSRAAGRWGNLPAKLFQDANNVRNRPTPARYKRLIERYRERISGSR